MWNGADFIKSFSWNVTRPTVKFGVPHLQQSPTPSPRNVPFVAAFYDFYPEEVLSRTWDQSKRYSISNATPAPPSTRAPPLSVFTSGHSDKLFLFSRPTLFPWACPVDTVEVGEYLRVYPMPKRYPRCAEVDWESTVSTFQVCRRRHGKCSGGDEAVYFHYLGVGCENMRVFFWGVHGTC